HASRCCGRHRSARRARADARGDTGGSCRQARGLWIPAGRDGQARLNMANEAKERIEIGLALQGGGALGAYECGAATALLELMDGAEELGRSIVLKCVAGVSVGAINAACIVGAPSRPDACRRLAALWDDLTLVPPALWPQHAP